MDSLSLILEALQASGTGPVLDIGCGNGALLRALGRSGAQTFGIDPSHEAVVSAATRAPSAQICVAGAERLPFKDGRFAGAVFLNSLHHIGGMREALLEAARVVRAGAPIVVIEPLTHGSFFRAFLTIEDETPVREAAQREIAAVVADGVLTVRRRVDYDRRDPFAGIEQFLERAAAPDRSRDLVIRQKRSEIERVFALEAEAAPDGGYVLTQPLRAHILATR